MANSKLELHNIVSKPIQASFKPSRCGSLADAFSLNKMATDLFYRVTSWLYSALAVSILGTWSLFALGLTASTAMSKDNGLVTLIATPSLLTWLVSRLIIAARPAKIAAANQSTTQTAQVHITPAAGAPEATASATVTRTTTTEVKPDDDSIAQWIASADNGSPHGALVLFLFACTWLVKLASVMLNLFVAVLVVILYAVTMWLSTLEDATATSAADVSGTFSSSLSTTTTPATSGFESADSNLTAILASFKNETGMDPQALIDAFPPLLLLQLVLVLAGMVIALTGYVALHALSAFKLVLSSPREAWVRGRAQVVPTPGLAAHPEMNQAAIAQQQ